MGLDGKSFLAGAMGMALGVIVLLAGCGVAKNWWPLFIFGVFALAPIPWLLQSSGDATGSTTIPIIPQFGTMVAGIILSTLFAMPAVMWHTDTITSGLQLGLWAASDALLLGSAGFMLYRSYAENIELGQMGV